MKAHIGVDAENEVVHAMTTTPANHHDITEADKLLHGKEIVMVPGKRKQLSDGPQERREKAKAGIRAKVEHPFRIIKQQFGFSKTRYRGMAKNNNQLSTMFALANLYKCRHKLMSDGVVRPGYARTHQKRKIMVDYRPVLRKLA